MSVREDLHRLVDELPEAVAGDALEYIRWLLSEEPEPALTPEEARDAEAGWEEYRRGEARPWARVREELGRE